MRRKRASRRRRSARFGPVRLYPIYGLAAPKNSGLTYGGSGFETKKEAEKAARADSREYGVRVRVVKWGEKRRAKPIKRRRISKRTRRTSKRSPRRTSRRR